MIKSIDPPDSPGPPTPVSNPAQGPTVLYVNPIPMAEFVFVAALPSPANPAPWVTQLVDDMHRFS